MSPARLQDGMGCGLAPALTETAEGIFTLSPEAVGNLGRFRALRAFGLGDFDRSPPELGPVERLNGGEGGGLVWEGDEGESPLRSGDPVLRVVQIEDVSEGREEVVDLAFCTVEGDVPNVECHE